jgi:transcriptional regulator of arginine metabolism
MSEYTKKERQQVIREMIGRQDIGDQPQLLEELKKRGYEATQATISRDLQEMGVAKVRIKAGVYKYEVIDKVSNEVIWDKLKVLFDNFVVDIKSTGNLILVKTSPGNANGVGSFIDRLDRPEILGTIAGDDTILVVVDTEENSRTVEADFNTLLRGAAADI